MATYVWLFPILFIFHDMEEIIGLIPWYQKNKKLYFLPNGMGYGWVVF